MKQFLLKESTVNELKNYIDDFEMTIDDVVLKLINENKTMKSQLECNFSKSDNDNYIFNQYIIHKLPKGKILVTENGKKVSNMKKIIIEAAKFLNLKSSDFDPNFTTYELGRLFFKHMNNQRS
ncbi:hypothetical protein [Acinetobacter brisouii]|uniref:hypothetical protein n=1 Tax=Acinetobacter brisouii TaxID=396323 RepID=UPI00124F1285|nr:hypothetical protein [Acinetobacter brisouii]